MTYTRTAVADDFTSSVGQPRCEDDPVQKREQADGNRFEYGETGGGRDGEVEEFQWRSNR
jgi:hypothetical protein